MNYLCIAIALVGLSLVAWSVSGAKTLEQQRATDKVCELNADSAFCKGFPNG